MRGSCDGRQCDSLPFPLVEEDAIMKWLLFWRLRAWPPAGGVIRFFIQQGPYVELKKSTISIIQNPLSLRYNGSIGTDLLG